MLADHVRTEMANVILVSRSQRRAINNRLTDERIRHGFPLLPSSIVGSPLRAINGCIRNRTTPKPVTKQRLKRLADFIY